jgi:hypothetical protein
MALLFERHALLLVLVKQVNESLVKPVKYAP